MQKKNRVRVKTYRAENGKWYVEVTSSTFTDRTFTDRVFMEGMQLDGADDIDFAVFLKKDDHDMGFESRSRARAYLKAYIRDTGINITGGLH